MSVSCGIPDFRSRDGLYARLAVEYPDLPDPQAMFDINYFERNPYPFFKFAKVWEVLKSHIMCTHKMQKEVHCSHLHIFCNLLCLIDFPSLCWWVMTPTAHILSYLHQLLHLSSFSYVGNLSWKFPTFSKSSIYQSHRLEEQITQKLHTEHRHTGASSWYTESGAMPWYVTFYTILIVIESECYPHEVYYFAGYFAIL